MTEKHYHLTMHMSIDTYEKLSQISEILNSEKFKSISISVLPEDLIPEELQEELGRCFIQMLINIKNIKRKLN